MTFCGCLIGKPSVYGGYGRFESEYIVSSYAPLAAQRIAAFAHLRRCTDQVINLRIPKEALKTNETIHFNLA